MWRSLVAGPLFDPSGGAARPSLLPVCLSLRSVGEKPRRAGADGSPQQQQQPARPLTQFALLTYRGCFIYERDVTQPERRRPLQGAGHARG